MTAKASLPNPIQEKSYWVDNFTVVEDDLDYIFNLFLETEEPLSLKDITFELISFRIRNESSKLKKQLKTGTIFQPKNSYEVGQMVMFPAHDYEMGEIISVREGNNTEYGDFTVMEVRFDEGDTKEFAFNLEDHALNIDPEEIETDDVDPNWVLRQFGRAIARKIKESFDEDDDVVYLGGRWFLQSLLANIDISHLHLAEAILDMNEGGPLRTSEIFKEIGLKEGVNNHLQVFSLDFAMQNDKRFDEVGPAGIVMWYLSRMEPKAVKETPYQLDYKAFDYDPSLLDDDMRNMLIEIDDELSPIELNDMDEDQVTITLTYPYRRTGTLPLSARLQYLFPTAFETTRIRMTLVDAQSGEEVAGWVVRELGYVYGFKEFFEQYMLPVGAYITLKRHDEDPSKLIVDFSNRPRPRTEWIRLAVPTIDRLTFENHKRSIGADYDDLINFGVEDIDALDALWSKYQHMSLAEIMRRLLPELSKLTPQAAVHAKSLYSAVNLIRRCPPDPIFALLVEDPDFENAGGDYWRMAAK